MVAPVEAMVIFPVFAPSLNPLLSRTYMVVAATVAAFAMVAVGPQDATLGEMSDVMETSYPAGAVAIMELVKYWPLMVKDLSVEATLLVARKPLSVLTEGALMVGLFTEIA